MSPERPFMDSGTERQTEPDHPRPTEEVAAVVPTPNRFWRMMTDPGFPSPASNPAPFMVTAEAFLGLTSQLQALAGMVQTIISYLPQLVHSMAHQPAPPAASPQTESLMAPNRGIPPDIEAPPPRVAEVLPASLTPTPARSQSRSYNPAPTELDLNTLSTDSTDSLREQVRRVHQRLDEVQKKSSDQERRQGKALKTLFKAERPLVLGDRLPWQFGSGMLQVLHSLQQLVVHPPSPSSGLLQHLLGIAQMAPYSLQLLLRGLAPDELLGLFPLYFLELLHQPGRVFLGLGNRLESSLRPQSVKLFLQLLDPIVHEGDQPTHIMDSINQRHLEVLALHESTTVRI
ncbi:hypothetical protein BHM03_00022413 [Ensete ventricosum]|nr:hypothetical protein BHM03_00022413 [Ensete ventricosum]